MPGCGNISGRGGTSFRKLFSIFIALCVFVFLVTTLKNLFKVSPEEQIRRLIQKASKAIERRDLPKSLSYVSTDYQDDMGFDYDGLAYTAAQVFRAYPKISVSSEILDISVNGDQASVDLTADAFGTIPPEKPEDLLAWRRSHRFLVTFRKEKKKWKVVATRKPPKGWSDTP